MDELREGEAYWSQQAKTFDEEPDHGLTDPQVRAAWVNRLKTWLPSGYGRVADLGCGTGTLSVLLAQDGAEVIGVDLSPAMIDLAMRKADDAAVAVRFSVGDASDPDLAAGSFDAVLCRHVLWNLPDPASVLGRWARLLRSGGRMVLIEGLWRNVADGQKLLGIPAAFLIETLSSMFARVDHYPLSEDTALWGKAVADERYAVVAAGAPGSARPDGSAPKAVSYGINRCSWDD
jgi:ubiquinone/menaquinone biosynthesis C-methylase UbiE